MMKRRVLLEAHSQASDVIWDGQERKWHLLRVLWDEQELIGEKESILSGGSII